MHRAEDRGREREHRSAYVRIGANRATPFMRARRMRGHRLQRALAGGSGWRSLRSSAVRCPRQWPAGPDPSLLSGSYHYP